MNSIQPGQRHETLNSDGRGQPPQGSRPRAGVRERARLATRQKLLEAGARLFAEHGFAATRAVDIAGAAGVAVGTLYLHYRDKDGLLSEVLGRAAGELTARTRASAAVGAGFRGRCEAFVDFADAHPDAARLLFAPEVAGTRPGAEALLRLVGEWEAELRDEVRRGRLRADVDPAIAAQASVGMLVSVLGRWTRDPERTDRTHLVDTLAKLGCAGLERPS